MGKEEGGSWAQNLKEERGPRPPQGEDGGIWEERKQEAPGAGGRLESYFPTLRTQGKEAGQCSE